MADYKISLGVDVDIAGIQEQINKAKVNPIKVNLDVKNTKKEIQDIKNNLRGIGFKDSSITKITKDLANVNLTVSKITTNLKKNGNLEISVKGMDKLNRTVNLVREYTKNGDLLNGKKFSQSFKTEIDEINVAFNKLKQKQKEISSLEFKLAGLDSKENAAEIKDITAQIRSLKKEYDKLYSGYGDKLSKSQNSELLKGFQDAENKIKQLKLGMADKIKFKIDIGSFEKDVSDIETKVKNLGNVSKELKNNIAQLKSNKTRMNTALDNGDIDAAIKAYERYLKLLKTINSQLGISGNTQKSLDADFDKLQKLANQIDVINKKLANLKLDPKSNALLIDELSVQLKEAEAAYDSLYKKLQGKMTSGQLDSLSESADRASNELKELEAKIASIRAKLASNIKSNFSGYDAKVEQLNEKFGRLSNASDEVKSGINSVKQALADMKNAASDDDLIEAEERYQAALKETEAQLRINKSVENQENNEESFAIKKEAAMIRLAGLFEDGSQAAKRFGAEVQVLQNELNECGNITSIDRVIGKISNLEKKVKNSGLQTKTFGGKLKEQFQRYSSYFSVASVMMYSIQAMRDMFEQVKLIDSAMTELKRLLMKQMLLIINS